MADPFSASLFGRLNPSMLPGYAVNPMTNPGMGVTGPDMKWSNFGGGSTPNAQQGANYGDPGMSYGTPYFGDNDRIHQQYVIGPWPDRAHLNITQYQIVCCARRLDHDYNLYTQVSLAKVQELLRSAWDTFEAARTNGDRDALEFRRFMVTYGEPMLEAYHRAARPLASAADKLVLQGMDPAALGDLRAFYEMHSRPVFKYLTKLGILSYWNVLGVVVGVNRPTGVEAADDQASEDHVSVLANVVAKRAVTHNIFADNSDLPTGADAYLVLRRTLMRGNRGPGAYEFVPYGTRARLRPPRYLSVYADEGERLIDAHIIPLGVVTQPAGKDAPLGIRELSAGLTGPHRAAFETIAALPTIHVQVGM
jgi:hypothetical protein